MNNSIGVDVSYYEVMWGLPLLGKYWKPETSIKPIDFVIQRTSYGIVKDKCFDFLYEKSVSQIPIIGFYHYFSSRMNYQKQMEVMLKIIEGKSYQFLAIDYEEFDNVLDNRTFAEFCEMVKQLKVITGKKVLSYFNPSIYQEHMQPFGADKVVKNWDIWLAQYPYMKNWDNYKFPALFRGTKVIIHQAGGGDIPGSIGNISGKDYGSWRNGIDLNVFCGTKEELYTWAKVDGTPPVDPEPPVVTTKSNLYIFSKDAYWTRPNNGPLVTPTYNLTKTSGQKEILLDAGWVNYLRNTNSTSAFNKIVAKDYGPSKGYNDRGKLIFNALIYPGRNIVRIKETLAGIDGEQWGIVESIPMTSVPTTTNYIDTPHLVHSVYGVKNGNWFTLTNTPHVPLLEDTTRYVQMKWLTPIDSLLPKTVRALSNINIRKEPNTSSSIVGSKRYNTSFNITEVVIGKGGIWGKVEEGYIALRYNDNNLTDWKI